MKGRVAKASENLTRRRTRMFRALAFCLGLTLSASIFEISLRFIYNDGELGRYTPYYQRFDPLWNQADAELIFVRKPFLYWEGKASCDSRAHRVVFRTDENGFRNRPGISQADIVFVGDSFTEAGNVPEENTFVRLVEDRLGASTANLGRGWYGPQQELTVLRRYGLSYRPQLVVWSVFEGNDVSDASSFETRIRTGDHGLSTRRPLRLLSDGMHGLYSIRLLHQVFDRLTEVPLSGTFLTASGVAERIDFDYAYTTDLLTRFSEGWRQMQQSLSSAAGLCREHNAQLIVLLIPTKIRAVGPYSTFASMEGVRSLVPGGDWDGCGELREHLEVLCESLELAFIDTTPDLRRAAKAGRIVYSLRHDSHLDIDGHTVIANCVLRGIRKDVRTPELASSNRCPDRQLFVTREESRVRLGK